MASKEPEVLFCIVTEILVPTAPHAQRLVFLPLFVEESRFCDQIDLKAHQQIVAIAVRMT